MNRKLATLLILTAFGAGMVVGLYVEQHQLQAAVIVANAKADAYMLAALDQAKACPAPRGAWTR